MKQKESFDYLKLKNLSKKLLSISKPLIEGNIRKGGINKPPSKPKPSTPPPAQKSNSKQLPMPICKPIRNLKKEYTLLIIEHYDFDKKIKKFLKDGWSICENKNIMFPTNVDNYIYILLERNIEEDKNV